VNTDATTRTKAPHDDVFKKMTRCERPSGPEASTSTVSASAIASLSPPPQTHTHTQKDENHLAAIWRAIKRGANGGPRGDFPRLFPHAKARVRRRNHAPKELNSSTHSLKRRAPDANQQLTAGFPAASSPLWPIVRREPLA